MSTLGHTTTLSIQKLSINGCETAVRQGYYEWARPWLKDEATPEWNDADESTKDCLIRLGYRCYDAGPFRRDNRISAADVWVTLGVDSGVAPFDLVRILGRADEAEPLLAKIPADLKLEDAQPSLVKTGIELIDVLRRDPKIGPAKATKVLHCKRPAFFAPIDRKVCDFFQRCFPHRVDAFWRISDIFPLFQEVLQTRRTPLTQIQQELQHVGIELSAARILDFLIWIAWEPPKWYDGQSFTIEKPEVNTIKGIWGVSWRQARKHAAELWAHQSE